MTDQDDPKWPVGADGELNDDFPVSDSDYKEKRKRDQPSPDDDYQSIPPLRFIGMAFLLGLICIGGFLLWMSNLDATPPSASVLERPPEWDCSTVLDQPGDIIAFIRVQESTIVDLMHVDSGDWCHLHQAWVTAAPAWSPDGRQIAIPVEDQHRSDIYVMNADGSDYRRLSTTPNFNRYPVWSPDGSQMAYLLSAFPQSIRLYVMNSDGTDIRLLTQSSQSISVPDWSPDGSQLVVSMAANDGPSMEDYENRDIYVINVSDGTATRLTNTIAIETTPSWSPDGTAILYKSTQDGMVEIKTMASDGTDQRSLTEPDSDTNYPVWSPDGTQIAYMTFKDDWPVIYLIDSDGTNQERLYISTAYQAISDPKWSPDGTRLMFTQDVDGKSTFVRVDRDGMNARFLTTSRWDYATGWNYAHSWRPVQPE